MAQSHWNMSHPFLLPHIVYMWLVEKAFWRFEPVRRLCSLNVENTFTARRLCTLGVISLIKREITYDYISCILLPGRLSWRHGQGTANTWGRMAGRRTRGWGQSNQVSMLYCCLSIRVTDTCSMSVVLQENHEWTGEWLHLILQTLILKKIHEWTAERP